MPWAADVLVFGSLVSFGLVDICLLKNSKSFQAEVDGNW
jgi:hypothetical protein